MCKESILQFQGLATCDIGPNCVVGVDVGTFDVVASRDTAFAGDWGGDVVWLDCRLKLKSLEREEAC